MKDTANPMMKSGKKRTKFSPFFINKTHYKLLKTYYSLSRYVTLSSPFAG